MSELRLLVRNLREELKRWRTEVEELLTLLVELGALAMNSSDLGGAMLRQRRGWLSFSSSTMLAVEPACDDANAVLEQEERARHVGRLGRHRIWDALEHHLCRGPDEDRDAQGQSFRKHLDGPKTRELFLPPSSRNHAGRSRRCLGVDLDVPSRELRLEILHVLKLAVLEERALHPADESLDGSLLVAASGRAHLDADADVDDGLSEGRVELFDVTASPRLLHDGARPIEDRHQRQAAERHEVSRETANDRLDALVFNEGDSSKREYFSREAKKWIRCLRPSTNFTSTWPKSC